MRAESVRLNQQLGNLKTEKTALEKEIVRMTKRIEELEVFDRVFSRLITAT